MTDDRTDEEPPMADPSETRLTVIGPGTRHGYLLCQCRCGNRRQVRADHIRTGVTRSCGCLMTESRFGRRRTHGRYGTPENRAWRNMLNRCHNPGSPDYARYGGRGIFVCNRWRRSFAAFLADMGERPGPAYSLDRIDNDRGYEPGNVRWATRVQQARNKRTNVVLSHDGQSRTVAEWSAITGISIGTILRRIRHHGFTESRALTEKVGRWARLLCDSCLSCGTTERRHRAKGLCTVCYSRAEKRRRAAPH